MTMAEIKYAPTAKGSTARPLEYSETRLCGAEVGFSQSPCMREVDHPGQCSTNPGGPKEHRSAEQKELETLRSQIASLRALAKTWEDEATAMDAHVARLHPGVLDISDPKEKPTDLHKRTKAITAIVGKE